MTDRTAALLAARYRLVRPLGQGGMGVVWEACDVLLNRDVAVKELAPNGLTEAELGDVRERAIREARALAQVDHVNVVRVFDVVRDDEDAPWIIMELVRSRSLFDVVNEDGPVTPARAAEIGLAVLNALRAAHRAGVLHRDVKPANVLLADGGRVVLTDFGLAEMAGDSAMTRTGVVLGSPSYLAPERALDEQPDLAADLWSLGATLYAAVEGRPPYEKSSPMATLAALLVEPPTPPERAGALRPALDALLRRDPAERADPDELERLLRAAMNDDPGPSTGTPASDATPEAAAKPAEATTAALPPAAPRRDRRRHWTIAAAIVVAAVAATGWPLTRSEGAEERTDAVAGPSAGASPSAEPDGVQAPLPVAVSVPTAKTAGSPPSPAAPPPSPGISVKPGDGAAPGQNKPGTAQTTVSTNPAAPPVVATTTKAQTTTPGIQIWNHETGTCLDARNTGGDLQLGNCQSRDSQKFTFPSDGTMRVLGLCVHIRGTEDGARLGMGTCNGSSAQRFHLNGRYDLVSVKVDKCVDVTDHNSGNAVPAQIWECTGAENQKWN
ncbi:protein kinase [Micromonospora sp. NPDC048898]|uniref:protein kinase domain-containing protein n=1 Tax=Micromonospora sp. NPDC048898 TaxID=3364260 RepID=UPI003717C902